MISVNPLKRLTGRVLGGLLALACPSAALAGLSCEEIMNMYDYQVPVDVMVSTVASSGTVFSDADIACLTQRGAPKEVIDQAKKMVAKAEPKPTTKPEEPDDEPAPTAQPTSRFDQAETLGNDDGTDEGGDAEVGDCPELDQAIRDHKAKKYQSATEALYKLEEDGSCPSKDTTIKYYLAKSLHEMEMYHSAQHYYMEVVRKGPENPLFRHALPRLAAIAEYTGNDIELLRVVGKIPPDAYPRESRPLLHYLMGRKAFDSEDLSEAAAHFEQVPTEDPLYPRAQYFEGIINYQREKYKSAVKSFREVIRAEPTMADSVSASELEDLKDLSLINIGRIYFGLQRFENAEQYYEKVQRTSVYWAESLFERAWAEFYQGRYNDTLGLLLTVDSPYFTEVEFIPETSYLRALTYFTYCEYTEVERLMTLFKARYQPIRNELREFVQRYSSDDARKLYDRAYDTYFGADASGSSLPKALFTRILRNRDLASLVRHMDMMDEELALIQAQKGTFAETVGDHLKKIIEADRQRYKTRAGQLLLSEAKEMYLVVDGLLQDADVLEFEVTDAQRSDYMFKTTNPDVDPLEAAPIDFATDPSTIYWPFNGEFWQDELAYYHYTEQGSCR